MKIISWNCNMAFRKKFSDVLKMRPDLLIIIECESKESLAPELEVTSYKEIIWIGDNVHKGIALIRYGDFKIEQASKYNTEFRYIIPFKLYKEQPINLFVIWAMPHEKIRSRSYVGQIWAAINYYSKELDESSVLIGDFNSNSIWDKTKKNGNHNDVVQFLNNKDIVSLYHLFNEEKHGHELTPTQYMYRHLDKPYHLDYCFTSRELINSSTSVAIGKVEKWIEFSDHLPIIIELEL